MANSRDNQRNELRKKRKGYTSRTSSHGQKFSSGGRPEKNDEGRPTDHNTQGTLNKRTGGSEKIY